jgi:hypothetical protein
MKSRWQSLRTALGRDARKSPALLRALTSPTVLEIGILYGLLGVYVVIATDAAVHLGWLAPVVGSLAVMAVWGLLRIVMALFVWMAVRSKPLVSRWLIALVPIALVVLIFTTNIDLSLRLRLSESEFQSQVDLIQTQIAHGRTNTINNIPTFHDRSYGLFSARILEIADDGTVVWFKTVNGDEPFPPPYSIRGGIVYCEKEHPPARPEMVYEHLFGRWWRWLQDT